jgi:hypothetical protein
LPRGPARESGTRRGAHRPQCVAAWQHTDVAGGDDDWAWHSASGATGGDGGGEARWHLSCGGGAPESRLAEICCCRED